MILPSLTKRREMIHDLQLRSAIKQPATSGKLTGFFAFAKALVNAFYFWGYFYFWHVGGAQNVYNR